MVQFLELSFVSGKLGFCQTFGFHEFFMLNCFIELLKVACNCVDCFWWWFKEARSMIWDVGCCFSVSIYRAGVDFYRSLHLHLHFSVRVSLTLLMSCSSATESLSPTSSENGAHDNLNQDPPPSSATQSKYTHSMGRGGSDHPCNPTEKGQISYAKVTKFGMGCTAHSSNPCPEKSIDSPLSPSVPLPAHVIGDTGPTEPRINDPLLFGPPPTPLVEHMEELIALCLLGKVWGESVPLPNIINKTKKDWKFIRGHVSYVDLGNNWISI